MALNISQEDALKLLCSGRRGVREWNRLRSEIGPGPVGLRQLAEHFSEEPDLRGFDLGGRDLRHVDFTRVHLNGAKLRDADLSGADFALADLSTVNLRGADLTGANLTSASLREANLRGADLGGAILRSTDLSGACFEHARFASTVIASDLTGVSGLELTFHYGPSYVDVGALLGTKTPLPEEFLRGCGIREEEIAYFSSIIAVHATFFSCFISYSTKDEEFAKRLYSRMRAENLRVWFAPKDIRGGQKLNEQIERAIQMHDRLLIVLSENSMHSEWVMTEIRNARRIEIQQNHRKLFPIRLVNFETIQKWKCFDADTGKDLAVELREYFIPDFSNWKNDDAFESAFERLLRDLKVEESPRS